MIATYRVLSVLLSYPSVEMQGATGDLVAAMGKENLLPPAHREAIVALIDDIAHADLLDVQARYVDLFDRTRALSLHLFEHVHGESRDRGEAMVSLLERYREAGLDISVKELPDYIPLFLEFLSLQSVHGARAMLGETAHILAALQERLKKRESAYAAVFEALIELSQVRPDAGAVAEMRETEIEDPGDLEALDRAWEEAEVRFGPDDAENGDCPRATEILRKMDAPATQSASRPLGGV